MLPNVGIVPVLDPDFTEGNINQSNIDGDVPFLELMQRVAHGLGKLDELTNPTPKKVSKPRNFGEITSKDEFEARCLSYRKGCAIGLLPAVTQIDYELDNFNQHVEILSGLDASAGVQPIYYSWVNTTCYPELLQHFEVDPFQVPSVVYFYPEKALQANLIGKFDQETIEDHSDRFLRGKLATWSNDK